MLAQTVETHTTYGVRLWKLCSTLGNKEVATMNSQLPRWRLPASHQELLRIALRGSHSSGSGLSLAQRTAIKQICLAPERHHFEPEDFLIAFKLAIVDAANAVGIPPGPERNELLARLVTAYIEEFYRTPRMITNSDAAHTSADVQPSI